MIKIKLNLIYTKDYSPLHLHSNVWRQCILCVVALALRFTLYEISILVAAFNANYRMLDEKQVASCPKAILIPNDGKASLELESIT